MNPTKLSLLINDTFDAVERSKVGNIYLRKEDGSLVTTSEGCPYSNQAAMQVFTVALQSQLMKRDIHET